MLTGSKILRVIMQGGFRNIVELKAPPCLDGFSHPLTSAPLSARRRAWSKLQECERRLVIATWAMDGTDPVTGKNHVLAEDCIAALIQSIETTLQVLKGEVDWKTANLKFESWLENSTAYSLPIRALRTI